MRRSRALASVAAAAAAAAVGGVLGGSPAAADSLGPVQWGFTGLGAPSASRTGIRSSWFRGNGTWNGGTAQGTIRADDSGGGSPKTRIALKVAGASALLPQITKYGYKGVGLVLPVTVTTTDDARCPKGTKGTITLFASYYSVHVDHMVAHFAAPCSDHDLTFSGSVFKLEIQRNGAQVNAG